MLLRARYPMIQSIEYVYLIGYFYGMTLEQLRIFVEVAQSLNMTRAAQALNLTQPSVSAAIAALEGRHGLRLFDRVGRSIELSEAGERSCPRRAAFWRGQERRRRRWTIWPDCGAAICASRPARRWRPIGCPRVWPVLRSAIRGSHWP
jgi:DNA-binding transcriptional ArsR family regulator